ncbi:MAG: D-hexose-6-phosphate mutarotase [Epsilonproteobacteria bacterium]|nr:MAG: D-hexose-6-phosphate mutarotase [Campylobacterota bacterium]
MEIKNNQAEAKIALQGGQLFHYKAIDKPALLWLSKLAYFEKGKAIRGGVPICFPWFGKHKNNASLAQHGFARTQMWEVVLEEEIDADSTYIRLELKSNADTLAQWPYFFEAHLDVIIGDTLSMALHVTNKDTKPFEISTALHTYFAVDDIDTVSVKGLGNCLYFDALKAETFMQYKDVQIQEEVDRVYSYPSKTISLLQNDTSVQIQQEGSNSLVVWNPWIEKSQGMIDMPDDGYKRMVCLETANTRDDARIVKANESHVLKVTISQ